MSGPLNVLHGSTLVGVLTQLADGSMSFAYAPGWLSAPTRFAVSLRLGLRAEPWGEPAHVFFSNLLPEADIRRQLCSKLGISVDNDFALLAAIGGDCAGALSLVDPEVAAPARRADYRRLTHDALEGIATNQVFSSLDASRGVRLSLAGAQDKLPVFMEGESIFVPLGEAPSTHLLKFPSPRFKHLPANEVLMSMMARALGLPVVETTLQKLGREGMCVVTRYDRRLTPSGAWERVHQEDLCQALGSRALTKYEKEGGPGFSQCFELVRSASSDPLADGQTLLRWLVFNVVAFNADGHAKNLSVVHDQGTVRLAPLYDLVCTRAYPKLARHLAMGVGAEFEPTLVKGRNWERLAEDLGVGARFVTSLVRELLEQCPVAFNAAAREFRERYGEKPALQLVLPKVRKQVKRVLQLLAL